MIFSLGHSGLLCLNSSSSSSFQGRSLETFCGQATVKRRRVGCSGSTVVCSNAWEQDGWYDYTELGVDTRDLNRQWDEFIGQQNRYSSNVPLQLLRMRMMGIEWQHRIKSCQLEKVYLIMFNTGANSSQGVYSIQIQDNSILGGNNNNAQNDENGPSAVDLILSFENKDDAVRYAGLLEALMVTKPCVYSISPDELMDFCEKRGHICWLQPQGTFITPPEKNAKFTNWERDLLEQQMRQEISQYLQQEQKALENSSQLSTQLFWSRDEEDDEDLEEVKGWLENILYRS